MNMNWIEYSSRTKEKLNSVGKTHSLDIQFTYRFQQNIPQTVQFHHLHFKINTHSIEETAQQQQWNKMRKYLEIYNNILWFRYNLFFFSVAFFRCVHLYIYISHLAFNSLWAGYVASLNIHS